MKLGIVGLPNSGKTTLYNAIMQTGAVASNYPFSTVSPNVGRVPVPDDRLYKLTKVFNPKKATPTAVEMVDIAGLVRGASKGEGLGNQFLSHIREVDALVHVVRCFYDENVPHVYDSINPVRDVEAVELELVLSDLELVERRLDKVIKIARTDRAYKREEEILVRIKETLDDGKAARTLQWDDSEDIRIVEGIPLISIKPVLYAANVSEASLTNEDAHQKKLSDFVALQNAKMYVSCAKLEADIADLDPEERELFLEEAGVGESGLTRLIRAGYELLRLISFFTGSPKEVRAWTIRQGLKAPQAAGKVHSDMERGFIRAEVIPFDELIAFGSYNAAKEKGMVRIEGKEYVVKDGDVVFVRFNV